MKTLYLTQATSNIVVDKESDIVDTLPVVDRYTIRNLYLAEEPMHVVYGFGDQKEEIDVKKGDLVALFYGRKGLENIPVLTTIKCPVWVKRIKKNLELDQKEREEWAKEKADSPSALNKACKSE